MRSVLVIPMLLLLSLPAAAARGPKPVHPYLDLDFEGNQCAAPWSTTSPGYTGTYDASETRSGKQSLRLQYVGRQPWSANPRQFGIGIEEFPAAEAAGRHIRLSGWIRTEAVDTAGRGTGAGLWWRVDGEENQTLGIANSPAATGTTPWTSFSLDLDVAAGAQAIYFGTFLEGSGTAWFDGLSVEIDGARWADGKVPAVSKPSAAAVSWLRKKALPFATPEAGNGFDDLQKLRKLVGDARIVSLGEDTHGTREFFQMKHRLVEFLASEMGFTLFAIEANMPEAYRMNEYVLTGKGDPRALLKGMYFWTWNTQEVLDMVEWMRAFNQSGRGRIQFLGFDMQTPTVAAANVRSFLLRAEPGYHAQAEAEMNLVESLAGSRLNGAPTSATPERAEAAAREVFDHLAGRRSAYLASFTPEEVDWAIQNARVVLQTAQTFTGTASRDESMAANVEWILDQAPPDAKIVLWAHNGHVGKIRDQMGAHLAERYGRDMVVLGFAFGGGQYNAVRPEGGLGPNEAAPPVPGSVESYLAAPRIPRFVVDLRGIPGSAPSAPWLAKTRPLRSIGALALQCGFQPSVAADEYDGLIWFDQTSPSVLLPF